MQNGNNLDNDVLIDAVELFGEENLLNNKIKKV